MTGQIDRYLTLVVLPPQTKGHRRGPMSSSLVGKCLDRSFFLGPPGAWCGHWCPLEPRLRPEVRRRLGGKSSWGRREGRVDPREPSSQPRQAHKQVQLASSSLIIGPAAACRCSSEAYPAVRRASMTRTLQIFYMKTTKKGKSKQKIYSTRHTFPNVVGLRPPKRKKKTECEEASSLDTNKCRDVGAAARPAPPRCTPDCRPPTPGPFPAK